MFEQSILRLSYLGCPKYLVKHSPDGQYFAFVNDSGTFFYRKKVYIQVKVQKKVTIHYHVYACTPCLHISGKDADHQVCRGARGCLDPLPLGSPPYPFPNVPSLPPTPKVIFFRCTPVINKDIRPLLIHPQPAIW